MRTSRRAALRGRSISALPPRDTLENTSWADIDIVARAGLASEYWNVGDTKTIAFPSPVLNSSAIEVEILSFYYDDLADNTGKAAISFGMVNCFGMSNSINNQDSNGPYLNWTNSVIRSKIGSDVVPVLQGVLGDGIVKPVYKRTGAGGESSSIVTTVDSAWLMSEFEALGRDEFSASAVGEKPPDKNACYPAFTDTSSRIKKLGVNPFEWWTRSPVRYNNQDFCCVTSSGSGSFRYATRNDGIAVGFCV